MRMLPLTLGVATTAVRPLENSIVEVKAARMVMWAWS
jgi:hypothetical protein